MNDYTKLPETHRRMLLITGIDPQGDVWTFSTSDAFRADAVLRQMKKSYRAVLFVEDPKGSHAVPKY